MTAITTFKNYRKIEPLLINPKNLDFNTVQKFEPDFRTIDPRSLFVDDKYQRNPSQASIRLVKKIIKEWSWTAFKPPICTAYENGDLYVLDGQHTSIAAASHPHITTIPIFVVQTTDLKERAEAFIRHNMDRTRVTDLQLFKARLEAGEDVATSLHMAVTRAGVSLVTNGAGDQIGDCTCLKTLETVMNQHGMMNLRKVLDVCIMAKLAPIRAHYVIAVADLMFGKLFRGKYDGEAIAITIRDYPYAKLAADVEYKSRINTSGQKRKHVATELIRHKYDEMFGSSN